MGHGFQMFPVYPSGLTPEDGAPGGQQWHWHVGLEDEHEDPGVSPGPWSDFDLQRCDLPSRFLRCQGGPNSASWGSAIFRYRLAYFILILWFPEMAWGYLSIIHFSLGFSIINQPFWVYPFMEPPIFLLLRVIHLILPAVFTHRSRSWYDTQSLPRMFCCLLFVAYVQKLSGFHTCYTHMVDCFPHVDRFLCPPMFGFKNWLEGNLQDTHIWR